MNIQELRETKVKLEQAVDYCPPDTAGDIAFEFAERHVRTAVNRLAQLETTFALLDAIDALAARLEELETATACRGCGQRVAWECPNCGWENHVEVNRPEPEPEGPSPDVF